MPVCAALFRANSAWDAWWLWDLSVWLGNCCGTAGLVGLPGTGRAAGRGLRCGMLGSRPGGTQKGVSGSPAAFHWKDRKMIAYVLMQLPEIDDFSFQVVYWGNNFNSRIGRGGGAVVPVVRGEVRRCRRRPAPRSAPGPCCPGTTLPLNSDRGCRIKLAVQSHRPCSRCPPHRGAG